MREDVINVEIGTFAKIQNGYAFKSKEYVDTGLRIIRIANVQSGEIIDRDPKFYPITRLDEFEDYIIEEDDFLISLTGNVGRVGRIDKNLLPALLNQRVGKLKILTDSISTDYLYYFLNSRGFVHQVIKTSKGVAQLNTSTKKIEKIKIPFFSIPEQRAIVVKIEELLSDLDKGIADIKKAQAQLVVYRQAVLSSSFPKKELMEISKLVPSLSQGWSPKCINQNSSDETQWAVIKTSAIQAGRFVDFENKILPESLEPREQHEIKTGDILITRAGPRVRVGICCLVRNTRPRLINCDKVYRLILDRDQVDGEYFEYVMNSPEILSEIEVMKSGTSDSGLNLTQKAFLKLRIPYVPLDQQRQIVRKIESRLSVCDKVEQSITESLEKAKALRQSILKKAFEGTLLSVEEIKACKAAKDYEPASILLKKIKAEKKKP
ncbi:restriction endonuclease subunit S [Saprospiraceae bacterium]|nr:restriction endonuclease subunit S [Saprospiraceae bacterium]